MSAKKKSKDPSMPFYVDSWLSSTAVSCMSLAEQGAFVRLLCHCWASQSASIPDDDRALSALSGLGKEWFKGSGETIRREFIQHPQSGAGTLTNEKLWECWMERVEWKIKCSEGGKKSAETRKGSSTTLATPLQVNNQVTGELNTNSLSLSSSLSLNTEERPPNPQRGNGDLIAAQQFVSEWNLTPGTVACRMTTEKRVKAFAVRSRDPTWDWRAALAKFPLKCFEGDDNWKPDIDWILKPDNVLKILEGKYDWSKEHGSNSGRGDHGSKQTGRHVSPTAEDDLAGLVFVNPAEAQRPQPS